VQQRGVPGSALLAEYTYETVQYSVGWIRNVSASEFPPRGLLLCWGTARVSCRGATGQSPERGLCAKGVNCIRCKTFLYPASTVQQCCLSNVQEYLGVASRWATTRPCTDVLAGAGYSRMYGYLPRRVKSWCYT